MEQASFHKSPLCPVDSHRIDCYYFACNLTPDERPEWRHSVSTIIYYFTGTGNSLKIAKDISQNIPDSEIRSIPAVLAQSKDIPVDSENVGIVFPVYVDGIPVIVERFIGSLKLNQNTYIFAVSNYGGSAGGSLLQIEDLLVERGCRLAAAFGIKMPDNTQILFPPSSPEEQLRDFERETLAAKKIAQAVIQNADTNKSRPRSRYQRPHPFNPIEMSKKFYSDDQCNGCAICESVCPVGNIVLEAMRPRWQDRCEMCLACMQWCPEQAIQFGPRTASWGRYHHPDIFVEELLRSPR
jgi:ferredoxin